MVVRHPGAVLPLVFAVRELEQCHSAVSLARVDHRQKNLVACLAFEAPSVKVFEAGLQAHLVLAGNQRKPSDRAPLGLVDWQSLVVSLAAKTLAASG